MSHIQTPDIIIPTSYTAITDTLAIADAAQHVSNTFPTQYLQEKTVYVYATNPLGLAAPLSVWVEIAPLDTATAFILLATATILVATGNAVIPWTTHSSFARVIVQCPAWVAGGWAVQVDYEAKGA